MEDFEIDDFEKLYALVSAELNSPAEYGKYIDNEENFNKIMNLAQYKIQNSQKFDEKHKTPTESDLNYYVIPIIMQIRAEQGLKKQMVELNADLITDANGNGLFIIAENGVILQTAELKQQIEIAYNKYAEYIEEGVISKEDIDGLFAVKDINDAMELIDGQDFTLEKVQTMIEGKIKERNPKIPEKEVNEQEKNEEEEKEEKEEDIEQEISDPLVLKIAERFGCKPDQVTYRKIDDFEKIEEDTGMNLRFYREKVASVNINRGFKQEDYLINMETGEPFVNYRGTIENPYIPEAREMSVKYKTVRGENARSYRNDEGRSYITHLDENGNAKEMKYMNNGKADDMSREERQRYIAEVNEANKVLQNAIDEYQKDNTQENWLRVKDAMKDKIIIDKKYKVLENQREETKEDLEETIDETLEKTPPKPNGRNIEDEDDEWFTRGGPRH